MPEQNHDDQPVVITRNLDLDVSVDELWRLVSNGERWPEWLIDQCDVVVEPASTGTVVDDDGLERQVAIRTVIPGQRVSFAWWPTDRPDESSSVEMVIAPSPSSDGHGSRLSITEIYASRATAQATNGPSADARWSLRMMLMVLCIDRSVLVTT